MAFNFLKALKECSILYCEDREDVRKTFALMLKDKVGNVSYCEDGAVGLKSYYANKPDLIITDIEMPNMDGLKMISKIRKDDTDIPIIVTTLRGDQDCLLKSIDLGVSNFLIKPIRKQTLFLTIGKVLKTLEDKKLANIYREKLEHERIEKNTKDIISQFSETLIEPIIILQNKEVKYMNKFFKNFFGEPNIKLIYENPDFINSLLDKKDGFNDTLEALTQDTPYKNKVSITINKKRHIFQVVVNELHLDGEKDKSKIYIFQDITMLEYQKIKIQNYNFRLQDYLIKTKYKDTTHTSTKDTEEKTEDVNKRAIDDEEKYLLRKSHIEKISAADFIQTIDETVYVELDELKELEHELDDALFDFVENPSLEFLEPIIIKFNKYASTIKSLYEFDELAQAIFSIATLLSNLTDVDAQKAQEIKMFLDNILLDLKAWRHAIFIMQETEDIHYLDSSLFSSCLQMELTLTGVKFDDDDDDDGIDFF